MAADVSYLVRIMNGYKEEQHGISKSTALITRDLLGGSSNSTAIDSQELELDLQVPSGFEKRLDLKVPTSSSSSFFIYIMCSKVENLCGFFVSF